MNMLSRRARQFVKLLRLLPNPVFRHGLRSGVGAAIEHRGVIAPMRLETIVDVGGNVGQFSLLARALHPHARIYAFEPLPDAASRYRRVFAADGNVTLFEAAISPEAGTATMHVSASADSSSLLPISARQSELFPGTQEVGVTDVAAGPLAEFVAAADLRAPALLKIDVQGFELEVLRGTGDLLAAFEHVYVEASFEALYEGQALADDVIAYMVAAGFSEAGRYNISIGPAGAPIQADFLFHRNA
ncbi:MAG: FkbM family methyltransferase [Alphaproteobacteria bacterium]